MEGEEEEEKGGEEEIETAIRRGELKEEQEQGKVVGEMLRERQRLLLRM